jgi:hypothetical protein
MLVADCLIELLDASIILNEVAILPLEISLN